MCRDGLVRDLEALPGHYEHCGSVLDGYREPRERTSGGPMPGMPFNTMASDVREEILSRLASWAGLVAEARGVAPPRRAVAPLARFLVLHIDWLAAHETAGDASREVAGTVGFARRVVAPSTERRVAVGTCVESGCGGELVAVLSPERPGSPPVIACGASSEHRWAAHEWTRLGRSLGRYVEPSARWLSAAEISRMWGVAVGSIYRMASEKGWRRQRSKGRSRYLEQDVAETLERL